MREPLLYKVYRALRRGWRRMTPETAAALQAFVASQQAVDGYMNAGGHLDAYYTQFGRVLEAVFSPRKLLHMPIHLTVQSSRTQETVYGRFFDFLEQELTFGMKRSIRTFGLSSRRRQERRNDEVKTLEMPRVMTTNAVCCLIAMQHQMGKELDEAHVDWLCQRQHPSGGFYASDMAPIPDLLSTAVALFTLRLIGVKAVDASDFIQVHWLDSGGFAPTLYDDYSDVEYVFYGLLALGTV